MTRTFVLLFKDTFKVYTYSSLKAIFEEFTKDELKVALSTLQKRDFSFDYYENDKIKIELSMTKTTGDVRREKEKFL